MTPLPRSIRHLAWFSILCSALHACSSAVQPNGDAATDSPAVDVIVLPDEGPQFCLFSDGRRCAINATCPAGDGCNTCSCQPNGQLFCTLTDCIPAMCRTAADCGPTVGLACIYHGAGCATGSVGLCEPARECAGMAYCGCDGLTHFGECNGPDAPYVSLGPCPTVNDGGSPRLDCNPIDSHCRSLPPECVPGEVPQVVDACWGTCVPFESCAPIPCDPSVTYGCPANTYCDATSRACAIGRL